MKLPELLTLLVTIVGTGVAVAALNLDVVGDLRTEVREDLRALRTDIHSLTDAQACTESRVAHLEGQLVQLNLIAKAAVATAPDEAEPSPGE